MAKWIAFFSQTGSEIVELSERLGRWPDVIVSNIRPDHLRTVTAKLKDHPVTFISNKPTEDEYREVLSKAIGPGDTYVITLHGWLRVVPESIIKEYSIMFNGHPGLITKYPELKGKDPQMKAWDLNLETTGCVIHKVTAGVDEGPILRQVEVSIKDLTMDEMFSTLHKTSVNLWADFLTRHWL
jgi:folate-dependent phosphoribosylglycinamide formyltransferase PurN